MKYFSHCKICNDKKIKIVKVFKKKNKGENLFGLEKRKKLLQIIA